MIEDRDLLLEIDNENLKTFYVKINVLDKDEKVLHSLISRVQNGSAINIDSSSALRRTCSLTIYAHEIELEDEDAPSSSVNSWFRINNKIQIFEGIKAVNQDTRWFKLGIFVINDMSLNHSNHGTIITLSLKDKMCLLNGDCAGNLPSSVTFSEYDQVIGHEVCQQDPREDKPVNLNDYTVYEYNNEFFTWSKGAGWAKTKADTIGSIVKRKHLIYDIIKTAVMFYGGEEGSRIFIDDVPLELKQSVRYIGSKTLFYNTKTGRYTTNENLVQSSDWRPFKYNEDCGYEYTDFVYPGELITGIGDNVCSVLDKIVQTLGNYEYFYDVDGNFHFRQIRNYLNTSYLPTLSQIKQLSEKDLGPVQDEKDILYAVRQLNPNATIVSYKGHFFKKDSNNIWQVYKDISVLDNKNILFSDFARSEYIFDSDSKLISSYSNSPRYENIKNDFHIWGKNDDGLAIHYHVVIKDKPRNFNTYQVVYLSDNPKEANYEKLRLANAGDEKVEEYTPSTWQAELYLQGLTQQASPATVYRKSLPDIYQQELMDMMDTIYNFRSHTWKQDITQPNNLKYWIDYLDPVKPLDQFSVDEVGPKIYSYQKDKIHKIFDSDIPNIVIVSTAMDKESREHIIENCITSGEQYSNVDPTIFSQLALGTWGYTAHETARELLYQYTDCLQSINLTVIPIYYLDVNTRITVNDKQSKIYGDYIIKNISLPLNAQTPMTISAVRALERV